MNISIIWKKIRRSYYSKSSKKSGDRNEGEKALRPPWHRRKERKTLLKGRTPMRSSIRVLGKERGPRRTLISREGKLAYQNVDAKGKGEKRRKQKDRNHMGGGCDGDWFAFIRDGMGHLFYWGIPRSLVLREGVFI